MSLEAIRSTVETHMRNNFTSLTLRYANIPSDTKNTAYAKVMIRFIPSTKTAYGTHGKRTNGLAEVLLNVPRNTGSNMLYVAADEVASLFDSQMIDSVQFYSGYVTTSTQDDETFSASYLVPFQSWS